MNTESSEILPFWWIGLLDGILLAFFAYALTLYFHNRQREYLYYGGYVGLYFVYFLAEQLRFYPVPGSPSILSDYFYWTDTPLQLLTIICYVRFFRLFFDLSRQLPLLNRLLGYLLIYCWACMGLDIAWKWSGLPAQVLSSVMVFARIPPTAMAIYSLAQIWKIYRVEGMYILSGILIMVVGIVCTMLTALNIVSWAAWPLFGNNPNTFLQLGIIGELLLFSLAISYRNKQAAVASMQANIQLEKAREREQLKDNVYTRITHEFRTPLTVILGMAHRLESAPEEKHLILKNSRKLLHLINQMLDLAKVHEGYSVPNYCQEDVLLFLQQLTESFQPYARLRSVQLSFQSQLRNLYMDYDPDWLERILGNLLSNALKFTENGWVRVHVHADPAQGQLQLRVQDSGKGIAPEHVPYVFDWFYQSEAQLNGPGSGIGLALVSELVQILGGNIHVSSQPGQGSLFEVCLPIRQTAPVPMAADTGRDGAEDYTQELQTIDPYPTAPLVSDTGTPMVLIVEDNEDVARYLEMSLTPAYQVHWVTNGKAGVEAAREEIPDMVICDVMMPEMNGLAVCQLLKTDERTSHIPVILLTAKATDRDRLDGLSEGADVYLTKPFHRDELLLQIRNLIAVRQLLQQHGQRMGQRARLPVREAGFLAKLDAVLERELDNDMFQVIDLCRQLGMSRTQLHRKITALTGSAIADYIRLYRLNRSRILLETEGITVAEAAYRTGFKSPSHYSRAFKQQFGYSPSQKQHP